MIAGGAILLSVFAFVQKQQKVYSEEISQTVLRDLGAMASGAQVAKGTSQVVEIPDSDITFSCTPECTCGLTIKSVTATLKDNLVLGQDKIKGAKMILWAQDWSIPLRVTNLLFLTTPRIKYYILHRPNGKLAQAFKERIPDNINFTFVSEGGATPATALIAGHVIEHIGYDAVRFVMLDDRPAAPLASCQVHDSFSDADVSCVAIRPDATTPGITNSYDIAIYDRPNSAGHIYRVIGETQVLAAIFADTSHQFECNLRQAYLRLSHIANLSAVRSNELELRRTQAGSTLCNGVPYFPLQPTISVGSSSGSSSGSTSGLSSGLSSGLLSTSNPLLGLAQASANLGSKEDLTNSLVPSPTNPSDAAVTTIKNSLVTIETRNQDLLRQDCPLLY